MTALVHEAHYLTIDGRDVFVETIAPAAPGDDAPDTVVCIHTAGQSGVQWRHVGRPLAALGYRVIVPDLPGHGRSEPAPGGPVTSLTDYADILGTILDRLDVDRPWVVGCSIGGKLTLELASRSRPLAGAIAMEAEPGPGRVNVAGLRRELEDVAGPARAERTYLGTLASVGRSVPDDAAAIVATMHKREDPEVSSSDLIGWGTHDVRDRLASITCPILVVAGLDDPWIDPARVAGAAEAIGPHARYLGLDGIGHYPMEEIPDFAGVLDGWIDGLRSAAEVSDRRASARTGATRSRPARTAASATEMRR